MGRNYLKVAIRNASAKDANVMAEAERKITLQPGQLMVHPHEIRDDQFRDMIGKLGDHPRGVYLVAELDAQPIAHASLMPNSSELLHHVAQLSLVVHPGHQGHGVGQRLVQHLIEWAKSRSLLEKIELQVCSTNAPAISLYKKNGFQEEGRWLRQVKIAEDQYLDGILMGLWL